MKTLRRTPTVGDPIEATDPESDVLVYSVSGADSAASFDIDDSLPGRIKYRRRTTALDHESPSDVGGDNVYELTLQVTDGGDADGNADASVDDTVALTITVIRSSTSRRSSALLRLNWRSPKTRRRTRTSVNPIAASDPESDGLTYSLAGVDAASFNVGPLTGQIKIEGLLDHESPSDVGGDNVYELTLEVTDGRDADGNADTAVDHTIALIITVTDVNEPPEFGSSAVELEIDENTATNTYIGESDRGLRPRIRRAHLLPGRS